MLPSQPGTPGRLSHQGIMFLGRPKAGTNSSSPWGGPPSISKPPTMGGLLALCTGPSRTGCWWLPGAPLAAALRLLDELVVSAGG